MSSVSHQLFFDNLSEAKTDVARLTILSLLCGISLPLFIRAIVKLKQRGLSKRSSRVVLGVCITNMALLILTFGITIAITLHTLGRPTVGNSFFILIYIQNLILPLVPLISDAIVIWRAVALYIEKRWMLIVPCSFFLGTIGISIWNLVTISRAMTFLLSLPAPSIDLGTALNPNSLQLFLPCSTITNAGATFCIWFKLWSYRKRVKEFGLETKQSLADRILVLLVESGVFFCALQLVNVFVTYFNGGFSMASSIVFPVYFVFSAMYPSMVVVFVDERSSVVEIFITSMAQQPSGSGYSSRERHPATFGHLSFASDLQENACESAHHPYDEESLTSDPLLSISIHDK